jgi:DNA-binding CsgD family transcriptional regulator/tetratricopeptide (TPR) repeat protein
VGGEGSQLVGRDAMLATTEAVLVDRSVVLHGPMGVGKTSVALAIAERRPSVVVPGRSSSTATALGALAPLLEALDLAASPPIDVLARVPDAVRAAHPDAVVVIDDAHHLDELSAAVTLRLATAGVRVMTTIRDGEPVPDAVTALWRDGVAERVQVPPLAPPEVAAQASAALGGPIEPSAAARLHRLSDGLPLLVRELVLAGVASGWLTEDGGIWRAAAGAPPPTQTIDELIGARLDACAPGARAALEIVAMVERLPLEPLLEFADHDDLIQLEDAELVRVESQAGATVIAVGHPLIGEVTRARTDPDRRQILADRLLAALLATPGHRADGTAPRDHAVRLGQLSLAGTRPDGALLLRASRAAGATYRFDLALELARASAATDGSVEARLAHGDAANAAGRWDEADEVLRCVLAEPELTDAQRAEGARVLASNLAWGLGRADEAVTVLRATDVADRTELDAHLASLLLVQGQVADCLAITERLMALDLSPPNRLRAAAGHAGAVMMSARPAEALAVVEAHLGDGFALAEEVPLALPELLGVQLLSHWVAGDLHAMETGAANLLSLGEALDDAEQIGFWSLMVGMALGVRGRPASAIPHLDTAVDRFGSSDPGRLRGWAYALRGTVAAMLGDRAAGRSLWERSMATPYDRLGSYDHDRWTCRALSVDGDPAAAVELARTGAAEARDRGGLSAEIILLDLATRLGDRTTAGRLGELHEASGRASALGAAALSLAQAAEAGDAAALLAAADERERMGTDLAAADAALAAASAALAAEARRDAFVAAHRAMALLERCEGAVPTAPVPAAVTELVLSDRELEIARLAADGHRNADIAERLYLSARTVGNHLHRAYAKADVDGRAELVDTLRTAGAFT